jgi:hypothetical protein
MRFLSTFCAAALFLTPSLRAAAPDPAGVEFFEKKIRPVLVENCYSCHSTQAGKKKGGLTLDTQAALLKGGDNGTAIVPGKPDESLLLKALTHKGETKMPPKGKLSDSVLSDFRHWVELGAPDPRTQAVTIASTIDWKKARVHWAFRPFARQPLPVVKDTSWAKTDIDRFILACLEAEGHHPVAAADKRALIRRATFDLTGLPPTPDEIDSFLKDNSEQAFERVIERLLASPHYGERWGRHWLDVARYAEDQAHTFGVKPNTEAFRYRDWIIGSLNADMPYDRFVKLQIAADQIDPEDTGHHWPALGFFGLGAQYYKNTDAARAAADELDDRVDTLSRGMLGLTISCARCHDHKFDPIPTQDYYSIAGIFYSCKLANLPMGSKEVTERFTAAQKKVQETDSRLKEFVKSERTRLKCTEAELPKKLDDEGRAKLETMKGELEKVKKAMPPAPPMAHGLADATPTDLHVYLRGNPATQGDLAPRRFIRVIAGDDAPRFSKGSGRLELADAVASKDNPLTARVIVNRVWSWHFGRGLVGTPSNFGQLGERPTHPELLDDLTARFVENGWSLKWLHTEIMRSATYQLSSSCDSRGIERDPDIRLLGRANRQRLDVESWRDSLLAASGQLDCTTGGPTTDLGSTANRRRTVYGKISRHELNGLLRLFDFPDANITSERRTETTVPQQQLFVLNSPFFVGQAKALAARLNSEEKDDAARVRRAYLIAYGRPATDAEIALALRYLSGKDDPAEANRNQLTRWERYAQALLAGNEFLYVD